MNESTQKVMPPIREINKSVQIRDSDRKEDWVECTLGEVFETVTGNTPPKKDIENYGDKIPFVKPPEIKNSSIGDTSELLSYEGKKKARVLPINSVLVTCIGNLGRIGINKIEVAFNQQINAIKPIEGIEPLFTFYQTQSSEFRNDLESLSTSTTVALVNKSNFNTISFKIPPLPIQRAIVTKLEELFSSLDSGIADLKKAQDQLVIYRQAVLKKAFEGALTKEWREKQTNLPSADELLEQIKEERQKHYKQQLEDWQAAIEVWEKSAKEGKKPNRPQKIKEYKRISEDEYSQLPLLPSSWNWGKFGNVCLRIMDGTHFSPKNLPSGDYKYITAKNIKDGRIDLTKLSYVSKEDHQEIYSRCDVKKGDVLYIKDGATTGRAAINIFDEEFSLLSSVGVFRTPHSLISPKFLEYYLNAQITRNRMLSNIAGVAITRLTLVKLNNSVFIICSPQEQHQIIREIETRLSVCDKVEESIAESLIQAEALRLSILKKAFEGKLLSAEEIAKCKADKDYEPASVLLERIKAEKKQK